MTVGNRAAWRAPSSSASLRRTPRPAATTSGRFVSMLLASPVMSVVGVTDRSSGGPSGASDGRSMSAFSSARLERCWRSTRATSVCSRVSSSSSRKTSCKLPCPVRWFSRASSRMRDGEPDVLQVEAQLLIGSVVARVRAPYLGGDFLAARPRGVLRARGVLGRRPPARIERSPGGEGLAHAQHQRVRLVERVRARERHAPLLVLGLEVGQARGRLASRLGGPGARLILGDLRVPLERDAQDGLEAGAPRQLGVVARRGAGVQRGQKCE